jgi:hypothetical protein
VKGHKKKTKQCFKRVKTTKKCVYHDIQFFYIFIYCETNDEVSPRFLFSFLFAPRLRGERALLSVDFQQENDGNRGMGCWAAFSGTVKSSLYCEEVFIIGIVRIELESYQ